MKLMMMMVMKKNTKKNKTHKERASKGTARGRRAAASAT